MLGWPDWKQYVQRVRQKVAYKHREFPNDMELRCSTRKLQTSIEFLEQMVSLTTQLHTLVFYNRICGSRSLYIHLLFLGFFCCPSFDEPQHAMDMHSPRSDDDVT